MLRFTAVLVTVLIVGCKYSTTRLSYWNSQKDQFKYLNKTEFRSDSALRAELPSLKMVDDSLFRKILKRPVYLYSWQERSKVTNEFTVVVDGVDWGLHTYYFVLDKRDSLICYKYIAGMYGEGDAWYEESAKFVRKDTIAMFRTLVGRSDNGINENIEYHVQALDTSFFHKNNRIQTIYKDVVLENIETEDSLHTE